MSVDELIEGLTDQWDIMLKLMKDLTTEYGGAGRDAWDKYYAQQPSYRNKNQRWNKLMIDKYIKVYKLAKKELRGK